MERHNSAIAGSRCWLPRFGHRFAPASARLGDQGEHADPRRCRMIADGILGCGTRTREARQPDARRRCRRAHGHGTRSARDLTNGAAHTPSIRASTAASTRSRSVRCSGVSAATAASASAENSWHSCASSAATTTSSSESPSAPTERRRQAHLWRGFCATGRVSPGAQRRPRATSQRATAVIWQRASDPCRPR
jgi:hypothetical protein